MADDNYFDELLYTPKETTFGLPAQIIAKNLPAVVNPYGSTGSNLAAVIGGGLLAGLLQYGAKREAEAANRELAPRLLDVMGATSQDELAQKLTQPGYERLAGLGSRLSLAMAENQRKQALETAKQEAELNREKQKELYKATLFNEPDVQKAFQEQKRIEKLYQEPKEPKLTPLEQPLPAGIGEKIALKKDAAQAAYNLIERIKAIPDLKFKAAQITGISAISGDTGLFQDIEQFATNYRASKFGMSLTGNELKSFNTASGNQLRATKQDLIKAYQYLAQTALNEAQGFAEVVTKPAQKTLEDIATLKTTLGKTTSTSEAYKRTRIAELKRLAGE